MVWQIYLVVVLVVSITTFVAYGWDKRQARVDGWRVSEKRLHVLALLGGWPGAFAGQQVFRHKTAKLSFALVTWAAAIAHVAALGALFWFQQSQ